MAAPKLSHLVLLGSNLDNSVRFYGALLPALGFHKTRDWVWLNQDGFAIDLRQADGDQSYERYAPGLNHFAFGVDSLTAFEQVLTALDVAGVSLPKVQTLGEARAVFIPDPDGLRIEIAWEPWNNE